MASAAASPATIDLSDLLSVCAGLATVAGESIRRIFDSGALGTIDKDKQDHVASSIAAQVVDPQTLADLESQRIIIGNLQRIYGPALRIVGEEGELDNAAGPDGARVHEVSRDRFKDVPFPADLKAVPIADLTLWIDPLDGTKEFTLGFVHYVTVLIGVSIRGRAVAGVVHVPFVGGKYVRKPDPLNTMVHKETPTAKEPGQTIWGAVGVGVFGIDRLDPASIPADRRFITTTRTHFSPTLAAVLEKLKPQQVIRCGGAGSKGLLVITREADAYVYPQPGTKRWDTCAIDACIKAEGGKFTDMYGDDIVYDPNAKYDNDKGLVGSMKEHQLYVLPKPEADKKAAL